VPLKHTYPRFIKRIIVGLYYIIILTLKKFEKAIRALLAREEAKWRKKGRATWLAQGD